LPSLRAIRDRLANDTTAAAFDVRTVFDVRISHERQVAAVRIQSRDAFMQAALPEEQHGFSSATLHSASCVALLTPYYTCPFTLARSNLVSQPGEYDGGKWTCGVAEITESRPCVVYSVGSGGNDIFERHIRALKPHCQIHVFDPTSTPLPQYAFHEYGLCGSGDSFVADGKSYPCKPLHAIMEELGHSQVDVLKFDIEGAEWDVLKLTDWAALRIGQILVELHDFEHAHPCASILRDVFHPLEAAGFYQFALEPVCSTQCSGQYEVAFVHSAWLPYEQTAYDAYDQIERRFDELDAWTRQVHPEYADRQWGIASLSLYATKKTRFINDVLRRSVPDARTACELGFMAGHSALLFLETLPQARIYSFDDLWDGPWALRNADRIATLYPGRFELIIGNSAETVLAFSSRGIECDVVFVDGSKEAAHRRNDMAVFRKLASQNAVVFLDEVSSAACIRGDSACHGDYSAISEMYLSLVKEEQLYILECVDTITEHDSFCAATFHPPALAPNDAAPDPDPPAPAASPASLPALSATVVSGYWDITSKHSPQAYRAWFNNTLRINAGMVFFYDDEAVRRFVAHVRRGLHTVFIQLALSDFAAAQLYNPAWVHEMHIPMPELGTIWLEKVFLVQRAARANPFNSSWFAWMDAGCAAYRERPPGDEPWPAERALAQLPRDRVIYTHVDAWYHHFAGTAFMYHADMVTPVRERFENEARRCAATLNAWPCGHDQFILTQLLDRNPAAFFKLGDGYGDLMLLLAAASSGSM